MKLEGKLGLFQNKNKIKKLNLKSILKSFDNFVKLKHLLEKYSLNFEQLKHAKSYIVDLNEHRTDSNFHEIVLLKINSHV